MNKEEIFEDGFFFTLIFDNNNVYLSQGPVRGEFYDPNDYPMIQLPAVRLSEPVRFRLADHSDTKDAAGRKIKLDFISEDSSIEAGFYIQFIRLLDESSVSFGSAVSNRSIDNIKAEPFGLERLFGEGTKEGHYIEGQGSRFILETITLSADDLLEHDKTVKKVGDKI